MITQTRKRRRRLTYCGWLSASALALLAVGRSRAQDHEASSAALPFTVEVCGLHVVGTCFPQSLGRSRGSAGGTTISLLVSSGNGRLLKFDDDASTITAFFDDQGKDLMDRFRPPNSWLFNRAAGPFVNGDGQTATIDVRVAALPTPGTREIYLEGRFVFKRASKVETVRGPVQLEGGVQAQLGPVVVRVKLVELDRHGDPHLEPTHKTIRLETEGQDPDSIETFQLLDGSGKLISESRGHGMQRQNQRTVGTFNLSVPRAVQSGAIEIGYWTDSALVEVPVKVSVSAGL